MKYIECQECRVLVGVDDDRCWNCGKDLSVKSSFERNFGADEA